MFDKKEQGRWWDFGWQLVEGCNHVSPGCDNCWSLEKEKRFNISKEIIFRSERLQRPLKRKKPTSYAIWNDLFHESIPFELTDRVFDIIEQCPQHTFQILTKRPENLKKYCDFNLSEPLANVWFGVTCENQEMANERIPILLQIPAVVRFVSCEPLLGAIDLTLIKQFNSEGKHICSYQVLIPIKNSGDSNRPALDWIIAGGESGHKARPMHPDWVRSLRDQCQESNTPFFFKQWGAWNPAWGAAEHIVYRDGKTIEATHDHPDAWINDLAEPVIKIGKKKAGSLLDGEEYKQFPKIQSVTL